ncbi:hypothetical protein ZWY2020_046612 [Hordeum vulgare]|nr:hypothetical protein ZWY2020_046612 [Hordeum vulgare]
MLKIEQTRPRFLLPRFSLSHWRREKPQAAISTPSPPLAVRRRPLTSAGAGQAPESCHTVIRRGPEHLRVGRLFGGLVLAPSVRRWGGGGSPPSGAAPRRDRRFSRPSLSCRGSGYMIVVEGQ